ncbi:MAG: exodeoxyribonuclease VII large subunit [Saprospiraceae bacterium]|nr:exodeoxyribonuclease VII large subunit [Saprospiraceae bacterium]MBK8549475.1 exodeoxyribonuclease VII large subunit [Saprospiraceae bacterium]MBK9044023.1 exodeoxyribonuclease VII large subunit [Saprospiraceae bacterium]
MSSYTLFELNEYIKRVIALNFQEPVWIECEISQVKESRGNFYLDFVQKKEDSDEVVAQSSGYLWYKSALFLKKKLGDLFAALLKDGTAVKIKVYIEFHERYGLKLNIEDIDPSFTIGQLEMLRQKIIQRLKEEGKLNSNKLIPIPSVVQKIAVISSETAAGYIDFVQQIQHNIYGYQFTHTLFSAALQGSNTEKEVTAALMNIYERADEFDIIVIIRGGGSKLDLAGFDNYLIAHTISVSPLPVIAGIGHEIDLTVTDIVSYFSAKTPTAVAAWLIDHNAGFESKISDKASQILQSAQQIVRNHILFVNQMISGLAVLPSEIISRNAMFLENQMSKLAFFAESKIRSHKDKLTLIEKTIELSDPENILKKGYTLVRHGNNIITKAVDIIDDTRYVIVFSDGNVSVKKDKNG